MPRARWAAGRRISNLGIEWNAENQLIEVLENETTIATFAYDPFGRRVEKVVGATTTTFTYDWADILREIAGATTTYYVHGPGIDEPLAKEISGSSTYYHADGLGSILKLTDGAGDVTHEYRYDAYGKIEAGSTQGGYSFTGREWDPEMGLYYYRARYYHPQGGRFISEDPIGFDGGDPNFYSYVGNRPTNWTDPSGLQWPQIMKPFRILRNQARYHMRPSQTNSTPRPMNPSQQQRWNDDLWRPIQRALDKPTKGGGKEYWSDPDGKPGGGIDPFMLGGVCPAVEPDPFDEGCVQETDWGPVNTGA